VPFGQILFGAARLSADVEGSATVAGRTTSVRESESSNEFALEAGGGVNIRLADRFGVRLDANYLRLGISEGGNALRVGAGVVIPF
jgi:opacity protein-like surface antigen